MRSTLIFALALGLATPAAAGSVGETAAAVAAGNTAARDVADAAFARAGETEALNAFITLNVDAARESADAIDAEVAGGGTPGPLAGVPIVVKDNIFAQGLPTTAGTPALRTFVPPVNAPVLQRLLDAGAILVGKTNLHELAFGITSNNAAFGPARNALAPDRIAGGSSGGTAAAIAAGVAPAGLGTDTGGSVRIPAALHGIAALRPTIGRYPAGGIVPISTTRDTAGPMALTVEDVALLDAVITGEDALPPVDLARVRLGIPDVLVGDVSAGTKAAFEAALAKLEVAGVTLVPVEYAPILGTTGEAGFPIALYEAKRDITAFLAKNVPELTIEALAAEIESPDVKGIFAGPILGDGAPPEAIYTAAMEEARPAAQSAYSALFAEHRLDALAFPTTPLPAQPILGSDETVTLNGEEVPTFLAYIRNTDPGSVMGVPGLTIPMGTAEDDLPVGLELDGLAGSDRALLSLGLAVGVIVSP